MPFAGIRNYSSAGVDSQGSYGYYWSSTWSSTSFSTNDAYDLRIDSTASIPQYNNDMAYGFSVRCLKDEPNPAICT